MAAVPVSVTVGMAVPIGVSIAVTMSIPVSVSVSRFSEAERREALMRTPVGPATLQQDRQIDVQGSGNAFQRAETRQDPAVLDAGDIGARQVRRRSQLFLGQAAETPPVADAGGNVGMTLRLGNRRWRRWRHFKRMIATAAPMAGGFKLNQAAAVTANDWPGIPRDGGSDRWCWNGCNAHVCCDQR